MVVHHQDMVGAVLQAVDGVNRPQTRIALVTDGVPPEQRAVLLGHGFTGLLRSAAKDLR